MVTRVPVAEGVALAVDVWAGAEPGFLLVHGLASNARMWDGVVGALRSRGRACATVDLRGHGQSDKPDWGYDFDTVVADVVRVIGSLGWSAPPVAVGQSWGGNVVVELGARHPEVVAGVVGVDGGEIELWREFSTWPDCAAALAPPALEGRLASEVEAEVRHRRPDWPETGIAGMMANFEVRADGTVAPWLTRDRHMQVLRSLYGHRPSELSLSVPVVMIPASTVPGGDHDLHAQHPSVVAGLLVERFP